MVQLKVGCRKRIKKPVPLVSVKIVSRQMVLDDRYGPVTTRHRRQAYMSEVGQMKYSVPEVWLDQQEALQTGEVTATLGEWANILMMLTYASLTDCKELTANFRGAFLSITHDVMLRRMKKANYKLAKEAREARKGDVSEAEEEAEGYTWRKSDQITQGQRDKVDFIKLPATGATGARIDEAVREWDLKRRYYESKREKGMQQQPSKAKVQQETSKQGEKPAQIPHPQQLQRKQLGEYQSKQGNAPRLEASRPTGVKERDYLPPEEYSKLTPEHKAALGVGK